MTDYDSPVRIIHRNVYNKAIGYDIRKISDFGILPSVGDRITELTNDDDIEHAVVTCRYFVTEVFEPSYWVLETREDDVDREALPVMLHSLLLTDLIEAEKQGVSSKEWVERVRQLVGDKPQGPRFKPKLRDPDPSRND